MKTGIRRIFPLAFFILACLLTGPALAQSELTVLKSEAESQAASQMLYNYLTKIAWEYLDAREQEIAAINSPALVEARKRLVRERMLATLGPLPEKTELKARITGRLERDGYTMEKVLYQSRPGFYVTGNLYLPAKGKTPHPAVLATCGHSLNGKAADVYQSLWIGLARMGFVVLTFDPPGQGERLMYWDEELGETLLKGTTTEHSMAGIQCLLTGSNAAAYFIWDMIRSIDYLISRPEVDPKRIAVTGNSGGGMQSAYIAALDDRLAVAVPSCYMTSWRRLWKTIGPQDAEQNMLPFIGSGLDFGDYALCFAPKPYLMNTAIQDFFSIIGARETFTEAKRIYELYGAGEKIDMFEADDYHGYTLPRREACMSWLGKHLLGLSTQQKEKPHLLEHDRNLRVTPTGQVITSYQDAETIGSLNKAYARRIMYSPRRPNSIQEFESFREELLAKVRELVAYERTTSELNIQNRGYARQPGAKVELITYDSEPGITIPALLFRPEAETAGDFPLVLYAAHNSKTDDAGGDIAVLVAAGHTVLAPDVRGKGETARPSRRSSLFQEWFSPDWDIPMMAFHVKKSLVGMQALDLVRGVDVLKAVHGNRNSQVIAVGKGSAGVPLLHAAAFDNRISRVILEGGLVSWRAVVEAKYHRHQLDNVVLGALAEYDLPALAAALAPRTLVLANVADPMGHTLAPEQVAAEYDQTNHCYKTLGHLENFLIAERQAGLEITRAYAAAFRR